MTTTCVCGCGRTLIDGYAHTDCTEQARGRLKEISELVEPARAVMYRQTATGGTVHSTPGPRDLLDYGAGARLDAVQTALTGWVADLDHAGTWKPTDGEVIPQAAAWLTERLEIIRHVAHADDILREIWDCLMAMRSIVATPAGRVYLGTCGAETRQDGCALRSDSLCQQAIDSLQRCAPDTCAAAQNQCNGDVYGKPDKAAAYCNACGAAYDQDERRIQVAKLVQGVPMRASVIAHAHGISVDTIRGWAWVKRDKDGNPLNEPKLKPAGRDDRGRPLYLVADVLALEKQAEQRRKQRAAQAAGMGARA